MNKKIVFKSSFKINTIIYSLLFFLLTLQDFYFKKIGFAYPIIFASLCFIIFNYKNLCPKISLKLLYLIIFILFYNFFRLVKSNDFAYSSLIHIIIAVFLILVFDRKIRNENTHLIVKMLEFTIIIHFFFLYFQFFYWLLFDQKINFVSIFGDMFSGSANTKGLIVNNIRLIRPSGLFAEPGTYSSLIISLVAVLSVLRLNYLVIIPACFSVVLASSTLGLILLFIYIIYVFSILPLKYKFFFISVFLILIISLDIQSFFTTHIERLFNYTSTLQQNDTVLSRLDNLKIYWSLENFLLGVEKDNLIIAVEDNTSFITAFINGGLFLFLMYIFLFLLLIFSNEKKIIFIILVVFFAKLKWTYFILWILLLIILNYNKLLGKNVHKKHF